MKGKLYLVGTPIGNLKDMSFRAIETLEMVDEILCEDTRDSQKLLNHYEIKKPLKSYHKFNYKAVIPEIVDELKGGKNIALITDAGMPCISDPGSEILPHLIENEIEYTIIPGACAFISAFCLSTFESPFTFIGFLPDNKKDEKKMLDELKDSKYTLIFYCAPHKLLQTVENIYKVFGNRKCCTVREITKLHEEVEFFDLEGGYKKEPKGEYVLIIEGNKIASENDLLSKTVKEHFEYYEKLGYSKNDAIKQVAKDRNVAKNIIYNEIVNLKK
ncbi:MAG: 16S rRNA (cytidine(1402)-2'-O)-methyltransferase [Clostridiales bacterium]|nr:16S rRNA (cytidine(1402)-2'-O)-methyltransferase [Candidatus Apopatousia equi]